MQRQDGQWDLFSNDSRKEDWVDCSSFEFKSNKEIVIFKTGTNLSRGEVLEAFDGNRQNNAEIAAKIEEQALAQTKLNQLAVQAKAENKVFEKSFFS